MEDEYNFKCASCNNAYKFEGTLKTHIMAKHCKSGSYNCDQCEYHRSFTIETASNLNKDLGVDHGKTPDETHSGEKSNKCNRCDYASSEADSLRTHLITHSGEKSNKCSQCDYA